MLGLVVSDGDGMDTVDQDVGGHEHGIRQQAEALPGLVGFLLVLGHPLQLTHPGHGPEDPGQLEVLGQI